MAKRKVMIERQRIHDIIRDGDTAVDGNGNEYFVNGVTNILQLPEYNNLDPQEGQIWKWQGRLWLYINGIIVLLGGTAPAVSSSSPSSSSPSPSSSLSSSSSPSL